MPSRHRLPFLLLGLLLFLHACATHRTVDTAPALARNATVAVDGAKIAYRDSGGQGRPLLLITGFAATMDQWSPEFVAALSAGRRVILLDNRGLGDSTWNAPGASALTMRRMADDALAVLDALRIAQADVLGWSMGGCIAQELALAHPDRVASLILHATVPDNRALMPTVDRMLAMSPSELGAAIFPPEWTTAHPDALSRLPRASRAPDRVVIRAQYLAMRDWSGALPGLSGLKVPVLLLAGDQDWVCPVSESRRLAAQLRQVRLHVQSGAGHWMMHQYPDELARTVLEFLDGVSVPLPEGAPDLRRNLSAGGEFVRRGDSLLLATGNADN